MWWTCLILFSYFYCFPIWYRSGSEETFKERFYFASWLLFLLTLITDKFSVSLEQKPIFENQDLICITNNWYWNKSYLFDLKLPISLWKPYKFKTLRQNILNSQPVSEVSIRQIERWQQKETFQNFYMIDNLVLIFVLVANLVCTSCYMFVNKVMQHNNRLLQR